MMTGTTNDPISSSGVFLPEMTRLAIIAIAYFASTQVGLACVVQPQGIASVWPPSGIALAALLLTKQRKWLRVLGVIFATNTAGNLIGGNSLLVSLGFALANCTENIFAAWALVSVCGSKITFQRIREVVARGAAAMVLNGVTALLGAAMPTLAFGAPYVHTWFT